jgi:hypothetical protein
VLDLGEFQGGDLRPMRERAYPIFAALAPCG